MTLARYVAVAVLLSGGAAQLIRPDVHNPTVQPKKNLWNDPNLDPQVGSILKRACADCHSNETRWPWYSKISPVSWWVNGHVEKGRAKLNFSNWTPSADQWEEIYDSVSKKKMPIAGYTVMHPEARLSDAEKKMLLAWVDGKSSEASR
jgi:cytochrome c551/c552